MNEEVRGPGRGIPPSPEAEYPGPGSSMGDDFPEALARS